MTAPHTPRTDASTSSYASGSEEVRSHARRLELHDAFVVDTRLHGKGQYYSSGTRWESMWRRRKVLASCTCCVVGIW